MIIKNIMIIKNKKLRKKFNLGNINKDSKNLIFTFLGGFCLVFIFFTFPIVIEWNHRIFTLSDEVKNNSKNNFKKVLKGEVLSQDSKTDEGLNVTNLFDDVLNFKDLPNDVVRLSAATIEQLFEDTDYNLRDVRETKLVKPIALSLLPREIKKIENTTKRKNLFVKIILPLVIEENNRIKIDRKKLFNILNKNKNSIAEKKWLGRKFKLYGVINKDLSTLKIRMDYVPASLTIAQAAKETGWGTSRFALEGNALFGQWTWSGEGIKPAASDSDSKHKVMKFKVLKASVRAYQRNLNTHSSYKEFRMVRAELRDNDEKIDSLKLVDHLDKYAETGKEYVEILKKIIKQNSLQDFDDVQLLPTSIELKNLI